MNPALLKLMQLRWGATVRRFTRRGPAKGRLVMGVVGVMLVLVYVLPSSLAAAAGRTNQEQVLRIAPMVMAAVLVLQMLLAADEKAIAFVPAEVDLLFPGPFSRRQLLAYKLVNNAAATMVMALFLSVMLLRHASFWVCAYVGTVLGYTFLQLVSITLAMARETLAERLYTRVRRVLLILGLGIVTLAAWTLLGGAGRDGADAARVLWESAPVRVALAPFSVFAHIFAARSLATEFPLYAAAGLGIDLALVGVIFGLDADYREASLNASAKLYERLQRARRGSIWTAAPSGAKVRSRSAMAPFLGGAGPIAQRQLLAAMRGSRGWLVGLAFVGAFVGFQVWIAHSGPGPAPVPLLVVAPVWAVMLLTTTLRFDFRGELDQMDWLKALPIHPAALAAGELAVPALLLTAVQVLGLGVLGWAMEPAPSTLMPALAAALPLSVLLFGIENLLFLLAPMRVGGGIADVQRIGRQLLVFLVKGLILAVCAGLVGGAGVAGYWVAGRSWPAACVAGWIVLCAVDAGMIMLIAEVFRRFDVSADMPV
jgi:hypothetical protein